jgi:CHAT domain-containing protein
LFAQQPSKEPIDIALALAREGQLNEAYQKINTLDNYDLNASDYAKKGQILLLCGKMQEATNALQQSIKLYESKHAIEQEYIHAQSDLAIVYWNQGKLQQASEQMALAIRLAMQFLSNEQELMADLENNMGLILNATEPKSALSFFQSALHRYHATSAERSKIGQTGLNIGFVYKSKAAYKEALSYFMESMSAFEAHYGKEHPNVAVSLAAIAQVYIEMQDLELARYYAEEALAMNLKLHGQRHPEVANSYALMGDIALKKKNFKQALDLLHNALIANTANFNAPEWNENPSYLEALQPLGMLYLFIRKANALEQLYFTRSLKNQHLRWALDCIDRGDDFLQQLRLQTANRSDQQRLSELTYELYESGQRIAYQLAKGSGRLKKYQAQAFHYTELGKSATLLQALAEMDAKKFANIPDELIHQEQELKASIGFLDIQFAMAKSFDDKLALKSQLAEQQKLLRDLVTFLQSNYPEYYELKNKPSVVSLAEIQAGLAPNEMVISYSFHDYSNKLAIYTIDHKKVNILYQKDGKAIKRMIRGYRNAIQYRLRTEYQQIGRELHTMLLPFGIPKRIDQLYIIPDGELAKIPFEALLTEVSATKEMMELPFLIKRYGISYNFSAALSQRNQSIPKELNALLIAPVTYYDPLSGTGLADLPATATEVKALNELFPKSTTLLQKDATKKRLYSENLSDYSFLHFAAHGKVEENAPDLSRLVLSRAGGDSETAIYAGEIYAWQLNAHLLCLSACETGLGRLSRAEGVIGLSRAFTFAGASNIIVSLWAVADESTAELMIALYSSLLSTEKPALIAPHLRTAKLQQIDRGQFAHPYYWAPFVLIGQ